MEFYPNTPAERAISGARHTLRQLILFCLGASAASFLFWSVQEWSSLSRTSQPGTWFLGTIVTSLLCGLPLGIVGWVGYKVLRFAFPRRSASWTR